MVQSKKNNRLINAFERDEILSTINPKIVAIIFVANVLFQLADRGMAIFQYAGILLLLVSLLSMDKNEYAFLLVSLQGCNRIMTLFGVSVLNIITILYFCHKYIFKKSFDKASVSGRILLPFTVFTVYSSQYILIKENITEFLIPIKLYFTVVFLIDIIYELKTKEEVKKYLGQLRIYFTIGIVITCLLAQLMNPYTMDATRFSVSEASGTNQLSIFIEIGIAFILMMIYGSRSKIMDIIMIVMLTALSYIGFSTQSRTFMVMIVFTFVWIVAFGIINKRTRSRAILYTLIMILIIVLFMTFATETQLHANVEETIDRFLNPKNGDVTGGRTQLWDIYMDVILSNARVFLTGDGAGGERIAGGVAAHNMYIEVFYAYGLIGTIIVIWMYTEFFRVLRDKFKSLGFSVVPFGFLPFILTFLAGMSSHSLLGMAPTVEFFFGVCSIYCADYITEESKKKRLFFRNNDKREKDDMFPIQRRGIK